MSCIQGLSVATVAGMTTTTKPEAWARFEAMLNALNAGDVITVDGAVTETGIGVESVEIVLNTLVRANLFEQRGYHFIRVGLLGDAELRRTFDSHLGRCQ
jgi:hypothetical protein